MKGNVRLRPFVKLVGFKLVKDHIEPTNPTLHDPANVDALIIDYCQRIKSGQKVLCVLNLIKACVLVIAHLLCFNYAFFLNLI
jgi:hypothetical protein